MHGYCLGCPCHRNTTPRKEVTLDITVYLPDELGQRAKEAELPFSRLLRSAVQDELARREAATDGADQMERHELQVRDDRGDYTARFTGQQVGGSDHHEVYLLEDGRVLWHDAREARLQEVDDPVEDLREILKTGTYRSVVERLGLTPVVEL